MKIIKLSFILFSVFWAQTSLANIRLKIEIAHKKGIDKSLFLVSELQSIEELDNNESVDLKIEHGIKVTIGVEFMEKNQAMTSVDFIKLQVKIFGVNGEFLKKFSGDLLVNIGETKKLQHNIKDQLVEISITPMSQ